MIWVLSRREDKTETGKNRRIVIAAAVARDQKAEKKVEKRTKRTKAAQETMVPLISRMLDMHIDSVKTYR